MDELSYNGKNFSEFNTFFDGSKAFGSPEKDYELVEIMGRNGSLSIYNDRFKDILLPFPCFVRENFLPSYRGLTQFLNSQHGYKRLETSKEPNHFRKALFQGIVEPQTTPFNHGGQFTINFLAKPQRFLKSGETPVSSESQDEEYEGNPSVINNPSGLSTVSSLEVGLEPIQDLHGYDSPWVGGAGKNICGSVLEVGNLSNIGTNAANPNRLRTKDYIPVNGGQTIVVSYDSSGAYSFALSGYTVDDYTTARIQSTSWTQNGSTITLDAEVKYVRLNFNLGSVEAKVSDVTNLQIEYGNTATAYEPYENICPIYGYDVKNLLKYPYVENSTSFERNGITWTINSDGSVKCKGTASSISYCWLYGGVSSSLMSTLKEGDEVIYSVQIDGIGGVGRQFILYGSPNVVYGTTDAPFTIPSMSGYNGNGIVLYVSSGSYVDATVYPMIRPAYISDDTFVPYEYGAEAKITGKNIYDTNWGYIGISRRTWGTGDDAMLRLLNSLSAGTYTFIMKATVDAVDSSSANREVGGIFLNSQTSINAEATFTTSDFKVGANLTAIKTFTINANQVGKFTNAYYYASASNASNDKATITDIGLFAGTQTDYEPYSGTVYPVKFPSINAWDEEWEVGNYDENTGEPITSANSTQRNKNPIHVKPSTEYYFCCETTIASAPSVMILEYDANGGFLGAFYKYAWSFSFTTKATTKTVNFRIYNTNMSALGDAGNLSFNYPSTYHTYIPHNTPQTVYGGTLDVTTGVLTVDKVAVDLGSLSYAYYSNGIRNDFYVELPNAIVPTQNGDTGAICSSYKRTSFSSDLSVMTNGCFCVSAYNLSANTRYLCIRDMRYTSAPDFKTAVTGQTLVYTLATPITYQLTPTQVSLLTGVNVISTDGNGDMTVTVTEPSLLVNPTLFESKPLLRIYGTGTVNINNQYITISAHSFPYIDIDCELMDAFYGSSNANQYVTFSDNDYITLKPGNNYIAYGNQIEVTPRWFEI